MRVRVILFSDGGFCDFLVLFGSNYLEVEGVGGVRRGVGFDFS